MAPHDRERRGIGVPAEASRVTVKLVMVAALTAVAAVLAYRDAFDLWFTGMDALPLILSARLESLLSLPRLLAQEYLWVYGGDTIAGSTGVRPVGSATLALDYAIWRLDPRGYHLTNVLLHALNTVLVLLLVREFRPKRWLVVGGVAALAFAMHPVGKAAVPLIPARFELFLGAFTLLTLIALLRYVRAPSVRRLAAVLAYGALALLSKETAVVLLPIVALTALWAHIHRGAPHRPQLLLVGAFATLVLAFAIYRTAVVGGVGGYALRAGDPIAGVIVMAQRLFIGLLQPFPMAEPGAAWRWGARLLAIVATAGFAVFTLFAARASFVRATSHGDSRLGRALADDLDTVTLLAVWLCTMLGFYTLMYVVTGIFKELYFYAVLSIWCTLFAMALVLVYDRARQGWRSREPGEAPSLVVTWVGVVMLGGLAFCWIRQSAPVERLRHWRAASEIALGYVHALARAVERLPSGATVFLASLPHELDCEVRICVGSNYIFEDYTVDSWLRLSRPATSLRLVALTFLRLHDVGASPRSEWAFESGDPTFVGRIDGAHMILPRFTAASEFFTVSLTSEPRQLARIAVADRAVFDGSHFLFDHYQPEPLMRFTEAGLVTVGGAGSWVSKASR